MMKITVILFSFLFISMACTRKAADTTPPIKDRDFNTEKLTDRSVDPQETYKELCASCHGARMEMFVDRRWTNGNTEEAIYRSISDGIVSSGMPAYSETLSQDEIQGLTDYILKGISDRSTYDISSEITPKYYRTDHYALQVDTIVGELEVPWGMKVAEDGKIYFTERQGTFKIYDPATGVTTDIKGVPSVRNEVQGGMLDIVLHPSFESNQWIYLSYSRFRKHEGETQSTTAVVRGKVRNGQWVEQEEIFEAQPFLDSKYHYGSRMVFDNDGYLYITVGDRGKRDDHPQFLSNSCGKVHRIYDDGRIPEDNPFYEVADAIKSIWSYGHRNAQGLVYDPATDKIWEHEHGPRGGDELNFIEKGVNYGWPIISYGINYNGTVFTELTEKEGCEQPIKIWIPSIGPSGMALVTGERYPKWNNSLLSGSLRFNYISRVRIEEGKLMEDERILQDVGRVRSIEMGADGYIYVGVERPGRILRVSIRADK